MYAYCWTIISFMHNAIAYVEINGELTFDLRAVEDGFKIRVSEDKKDVERSREEAVRSTAAIGLASEELETAAAAADGCVYKLPETKQLEALRSDLMNQLTKIFVRAYKAGGRADRRGAKRFSIANETIDSRFFERAYSHMSQQFSESINSTLKVSRLSGRDPCRHQAQVRQLWRDLLERSRAVLKRAATRCAGGLLRSPRADDRAKEKIQQMIRREVKEVRANQLKVLCDGFKLCYKNLL